MRLILPMLEDKMKLTEENKQNHNLLSERAALIKVDAEHCGRNMRGVNWKRAIRQKRLIKKSRKFN